MGTPGTDRGRAGRVIDSFVDLGAGGRGRILLTVAVGWLLVIGTRMILPALLPQIKGEFAIGNTMAGMLLTVLYIAYAAMQFPAGILADRIGERRTLVLSLLSTTIGVAVLAVAPGLPTLVGGIVLFALGSGLYGSPRVTVLTRTFADRTGTALGLTFAAGNVGTSLLPILAGFIALLMGWRTGFGIVILPLIGVAIGVWWTLPDRTTGASDREEPTVSAELVDALLTRRIVTAWVAMTLLLMAYQGITAFLPTYFVEVKGMGPSLASTLFGLFFAAGALWQWGAGVWADRGGPRQTMLMVGFLATVSVGILPVVTGPIGLALLCLLLGSRLGVIPLNNAYVAASFPADIRGSGLGLFRALQLFVSAGGSLVVGIFADVGWFDEAFLFLATITGLGTIGYLFLPTIDADRHDDGMAAE